MKCKVLRVKEMSEKYYIVSESRLQQLEKAESELMALNEMGVDNWHGCQYIDWEELEGDVSLEEYEVVKSVE